jgi:hypothetical protein
MEDLIAVGLFFFVVLILPTLKKILRVKAESAPEGEKPKQHMGTFHKEALEAFKENVREDQAIRTRVQGEEQGGADNGFLSEFLSSSEDGEGDRTTEGMGEKTSDIPFSPSVNGQGVTSDFSGATPLFTGKEESDCYSQPSGTEPPSPPASKWGEPHADEDANGEALYHYDKASLRNAVVWSEILAPPMALREP